MIKKEYLSIQLDDLVPYWNNPRKNDAAVPDVMESIRQCSYISPIVINRDKVVLSGHTTLKALQKLGYKEAVVEVVDGLTEEQERKYRIYDNKTAEFARWEKDKLEKELADVDFDGYDFGQGLKAVEEIEKDGVKVAVRTCPCCGEVFEV